MIVTDNLLLVTYQHLIYNSNSVYYVSTVTNLPSLGLVSRRDLTSELRELSTLVDCCKRVLVAFPLWTLLGSDGGLGGSNPDSISSSDGSFGF